MTIDPRRILGSTLGLGVAAIFLAAAIARPLRAQVGGDPGNGLESAGDAIVNGVLEFGHPAVGMLGFGGCTGTLIGCRTVLTAAHCLCTDFSKDPPEDLDGAECLSRPGVLDPAGVFVFFQNAGFFDATRLDVHPSYRFGVRSDVALIRLDRPVTGIPPARINRAHRPPPGTGGTIVGFGVTEGGERDAGLKRSGQVVTSDCGGGDPFHLCWDFANPVGPVGVDSNTCFGDSGGPLFVDLGQGSVVAGVTSGGTSDTCLPLDLSFDADVFVDRAWILSAAGSDVDATTCGDLVPVGQPGTSVLVGQGTLSEAQPERRFTVEVPPGRAALRFGLNGELDFPDDFDLYVKRQAPPSTESFDCRGTSRAPLEFCELTTPAGGTWHILARQFQGEGRFQLTTTVLGKAAAPDDGTPPGPWLRSDSLPGFEAKVRITSGAAAVAGALEPQCIVETLCASGALAGRPEVFLKVIGPRPNGFLWTQISRFTPSTVEVWVRQIATGQIRSYLLEAVGAASDDVSGLQDREAFTP